MEKYLNIFNYAPFLMWNDNEDLSKDKLKILNKMEINNNIVKKNKNDNIELMKDVFFSLDNIDIIQYRLIIGVYYKSNQKLRIKKIKNESIIQVMNYIWNNFCNFLPYNYKEQIDKLDDKVVEYIIPLLLKESEFYFKYLSDLDRTNRKLLDRPKMIYNNKKN